MLPILRTLQANELSLDKGEARRVWKHFAKYTILFTKLYKIERTSPMLMCLSENETAMVLAWVHKGACNSHIGRKIFVHNLLWAGYYWPTMIKDNIHQEVWLVSEAGWPSPYPNRASLINDDTLSFQPVGVVVDILALFPLALGQLTFLIIGVNCITNWIKAEIIAKITTKKGLSLLLIENYV